MGCSDCETKLRALEGRLQTLQVKLTAREESWEEEVRDRETTIRNLQLQLAGGSAPPAPMDTSGAGSHEGPTSPVGPAPKASAFGLKMGTKRHGR